MLKLVSKFAMDIFPSVIATILGAYIVNHYINNKTPAADTAAAVSTADPKKAASKAEFEACRALGRPWHCAGAWRPGEGDFRKVDHRQGGSRQGDL